MTDRSRDLDDIRLNRRGVARPKALRRVRLARRPTVEALEGRALLSTAGSPDFTYGTEGLAAINFDPQDSSMASSATSVVLQSDGKEVVAGFLSPSLFRTSSTIHVARLNADGTPDTTFGNQGAVALPATNGYDEGKAVAIQTDGKIVVAADVSTRRLLLDPAGRGLPAERRRHARHHVRHERRRQLLVRAGDDGAVLRAPRLWRSRPTARSSSGAMARPPPTASSPPWPGSTPMGRPTRPSAPRARPC